MTTFPTGFPTPEPFAAAHAQPLIVFAGGGSGGHIYPALSILEAIHQLRGPGTTPAMAFVTSDRAIDAKILESAPYPVEPSPARPMIATPMGMLRFIRGWFAAKRQALDYLRSPEWPKDRSVQVVAMGGFVAAPFVAAAKRMGVPITMVNLDAVPGKANRYIARHANRIFTAARVATELRAGREWVEVPPIVGGMARAHFSREESRSRLNLDPKRNVLMVTGGSQGLRSLNEFVIGFAKSEAGQRTLKDGSWQVLHQTGRNLDEAARAAYAAVGIDALVVPFVNVIGRWYGAADLVVCTAGAGNIGEIWQNKTPALLLPYPHHKDEHQKFNAAPLRECGGAVVRRDWIDPKLNQEHNAAELESLLTDSTRRAAMRVNLEKLGPADGATRIAQALLDTFRAGSSPS